MSKRRKKCEVQVIWIDDPCVTPVQDVSKFVGFQEDRFAHLERWQEKALQFVRLRLQAHRNVL